MSRSYSSRCQRTMPTLHTALCASLLEALNDSRSLLMQVRRRSSNRHGVSVLRDECYVAMLTVSQMLQYSICKVSRVSCPSQLLDPDRPERRTWHPLSKPTNLCLDRCRIRQGLSGLAHDQTLKHVLRRPDFVLRPAR